MAHIAQHTWDDVCVQGSWVPLALRHVIWPRAADAVVKLLPSSGSTGLPKLVVLTDQMMRPAAQQAPVCSRHTVMYAYETMRQAQDSVYIGASVGVFSGALERLCEDCRLLRPTVFAAAPVFWTGLHAQFECEVQRALLRDSSPNCVKAGVCSTALVDARRDADGVPFMSAQEAECRAAAHIRWEGQQLLGNRLQAIISTGAPVSHQVKRWVCRVFGRMLVDGYGSTETGGLASNGVVRAGVELRLLDCPALGFSTADRPHPRGEILARTGRMARYFQRQHYCAASGAMLGDAGLGPGESSDWVVLNGLRYFRTGDIGEMRDGCIQVIDRCKSVFKLAQGVFVAPETLEQLYLSSPLVSQIFVCGAGYMSSVAAVIVPTPLLVDLCCAALEAQDSPTSPANPSAHPSTGQSTETITVAMLCADVSLNTLALQLLRRSLLDIHTQHGLRPWELPQRLLLHPEAFTARNGLLSGVGKHCRPALLRAFAHLLIPEVGMGGGTPSVGTEGGFKAIPRSLQPAEGGDAPMLPAEPMVCGGLAEILHEVLPDAQHLSPAPSLPHSTSIAGLGLDSMAAARLSARLQQRFGISLPPRVLLCLPSLGDLEAALFGGDAALRRGLGRGDSIDWMAQVSQALGQLLRDVAADQALGPRTNSDHETRSASMERTVLVTGATGFLGAFVLHRLLVQALTHTDKDTSPPAVVCLVRAGSAAEGLFRLETAARFYRLWDPQLYANLLVLPGDVGQRWLGLECAAFDELAQRPLSVFHCAAEVNSVQPYAVLQASNVTGTQHVLELVLRSASLHPCTTELTHVSTMGFLPAFHPASQPVPWAGLAKVGGYGQSKWVAEQLVLAAARASGCRVRVFRPGTIAGSVRSGACNTRDSVVLLLRGLVDIGLTCAPLLPRAYNLCPVDWVAAAIASPDFEPGQVQHLCAPQETSHEALCQAVRQAGWALREVPVSEFAGRVRAIDETHALFFLKAALSSSATGPAPDSSTGWQAVSLAAAAADAVTEKSAVSGVVGSTAADGALHSHTTPEDVGRWLCFLQGAQLLRAPP